MTWLKVDDSMLDHPKWVRAVKIGGSGAVHLWLAMSTWSARHLTDGLVPADMLAAVGGPEQRRARALEGLTMTGLVSRHDGGTTEARRRHDGGTYEIHDFLDYNQSREAVLRNRELKIERQKKHILKSKGDATPSRDMGATPSRAPDPDPVPIKKETPLSPPAKPKRKTVEASALPADWTPSDAHRAFAAKHGLDLELEAEGMRGWAEGRKTPSWNGTFHTRLSNAAKWKRERPVPAKPKQQGKTVAQVMLEMGVKPK